MIIKDPVFGEIEYTYGWCKDITIDFLGKEVEIALVVDGDVDSKFEEAQYHAYQEFMKNWPQLQHRILQPILDYYQLTRQGLGYNIEFNASYPLVETIEQLLGMITLVGLIVSYGDIYEERDIGLTFDCTWDEENGLGIRLLNEKVMEVGYQDVAM